MVNEDDEIIGYAMFSRFHIEGRYENALLILTPVAVKTKLQRQHISKDLLEYGFEKARELNFKAILVEGNPKNYNPRGFQSSYKFRIEADTVPENYTYDRADEIKDLANVDKMLQAYEE